MNKKILIVSESKCLSDVLKDFAKAKGLPYVDAEQVIRRVLLGTHNLNKLHAIESSVLDAIFSQGECVLFVAVDTFVAEENEERFRDCVKVYVKLGDANDLTENVAVEIDNYMRGATDYTICVRQKSQLLDKLFDII